MARAKARSRDRIKADAELLIALSLLNSYVGLPHVLPLSRLETDRPPINPPTGGFR